MRFNPLDFAHFQLNVTKPNQIDSTPFKLVENISDLNYMATKLSEADEFAVDLEHNSYRSFQGMTCLMQISTREEDFVVDTLKLRDNIGDYLRQVFQDPNKRKVMHGASNDILWLQRDFDIYVCNLFDTMQASKVLGLERNSLEFLLKHYCGVIANKKYQTSDWRMRPLPCDMVRYAREDTHYLLYIHDVMKNTLVHEYGGDFLAEVYRKSYEVCVQLYKKEVFSNTTSYLYLHGLPEANLNATQLFVLSALFEWRDTVARQDDESTGYVLPNKQLLEIAKRLPEKKEDLLEIVGYNKPYVLKNADSMVKSIQALIRNEATIAKFEGVSQLLKQRMHVSDIATHVQQAERYDNEAGRLGMMYYSNPRCYPNFRVINPAYIQFVTMVPSICH
ncbi:hypothetical protein SOVF_140560 [Spinacia oleracea]|nr:hypothetical protein SOVF_140560 [Spinacia oleracea]